MVSRQRDYHDTVMLKVDDRTARRARPVPFGRPGDRLQFRNHVRFERARRVGRPPTAPRRVHVRLVQVPVPHSLVQVPQLFGEPLRTERLLPE